MGVKTVAFESNKNITFRDPTGIRADLRDQTLTISLKEAAAAEIGEGLEWKRTHRGRG